MRMVELPIVRALVNARIREIEWSPVRQLFSIAAISIGGVVGAVASGVRSSTLTATNVLSCVIPLMLGTTLGIAASPIGRTLFDITFDPKESSGGHVMTQLPASAFDRLVAASLLAVPLALPYVAGMLLTGLLPHKSATSVALHLSLMVLGFGAERAWRQVPRDRLRSLGMRQQWSLPVYSAPQGGEVRAAFWALAAQSVFAPVVVVVAALLLLAWMVPSLAADLGAMNGSLAAAGVAAGFVAMGLLSLSSLLQPLSAIALSRRSLALALLLFVFVGALLIGAPAIALATLYYGSAAGAPGAIQLLVAIIGFVALAAVAVARVAPAAHQIALSTIFGCVFATALTLTCMVSVRIPVVMHVFEGLSAVAFALALLLALTTPRVPLSREPIGVVGAALRLIGVA